MNVWQWLGIAVGVWLLVILVLILAGKRAAAFAAAKVIPDVVRLFKGLLRERRVRWIPKAVLLLAIGWIVSPIDLIPEFIPVAGPLDDMIVAILALRFTLRSTPREVVREHWRGSDRLLARLSGDRGGDRGGDPGGQQALPGPD